MYQVGWVFNSEKHRQDMETIISLTQDQGTLDELGLGSVRDGFANMFFPGTTTIMTRAKYFLIVPWILEDIYKKNDDFGKLAQLLRTEEGKVIEFLKTTKDQDGLIGKEVGVRLKRMPSSVYWTGLKKFGIILPDITMSQLPVFFRKKYGLENTASIKRLTKQDKLADLYESKEAVYFTSDDLPPYPGLKSLSLRMTKLEAEFLRKRILLKEPDSLLAYLLNDIEKRKDFLLVSSFEDLVTYAGKSCPLNMSLQAALLFDKIMKGVYIRYNYKLSLYAEAQTKLVWTTNWDNYLASMRKLDFSENSFDLYFKDFKINENTVQFCKQWIRFIKEDVINEKTIDELLRSREVKLKGNERSRLNNPTLAQKTALPIGVSFNQNTGEVLYLNFRFYIAKKIIQDIFNGLTNTASNEQ